MAPSEDHQLKNFLMAVRSSMLFTTKLESLNVGLLMMPKLKPKVDFFLIGAARCGTKRP